MLPIVGAVLALIFGYKGRREIDSSHGTQSGAQLARAGIITGWIGLVWGVIVVGLWIWFFIFFITHAGDTVEQGPKHGQLRICESASVMQAEFESSFGTRTHRRLGEIDFFPHPPAEAQDAPGRMLDLAEMVDRKTGREEMWAAQLSHLGFLRGHVDSFAVNNQAIWVEVYEFPNERNALALQRWTNDLNCPFSNELFSVSGVPESIGFQVRWSSGQTTEQVSFVRGNRRILVGSTNWSNQPPPRDLLELGVRQAAEAVVP
jgi:hypothetical protein